MSVKIPDQILENIPVERVLPNPQQPRRDFNQESLEELASSIRVHGVIKPIVVERLGDMFILHDGERRLRASKIARKATIPAIIGPPLNGTGEQMRLERALIANIQREDMNPVDEARAFLKLQTAHNLTASEIGRRTGKAQSVVSTRIKLARLNPEILELMREKKLSTEGKAVTALFSIDDEQQRIDMAMRLASRRASAKTVVRACERFNKMQAESQTGKQTTLAIAMAQKVREEDLPEWDALYQLGKVPPWPMVNDAVMTTCDSCALRRMASEAVCGSCALVAMVGKLVEAVHERR